ncbi:unnamed protein product, partial [Mesorhabditis spiculigera]
MWADYDTACQMMVKEGHKFWDRPGHTKTSQAAKAGVWGITIISGDLWQDQRRFLVHTLKEFGMGKGLMEHHVLSEVEDMFKRVDAQPENVDLRLQSDIAIASLSNQLLFGYRLEKDNLDRFLGFNELVYHHMERMGHPMTVLINHMHWLRHLPYWKNAQEHVNELVNALAEFVDTQIEQHAAMANNNEPSKEPEDLIEAFLAERKIAEGTEREEFYCHRQLRALLLDMVIAGYHTTSCTYGWTLAFLVKYPEYQRRAQEELDRAIGDDRLVTMADKVHLPFCQAILQEVHRYGTAGLLTLHHAASEDVHVQGYTVPKGCTVYSLNVCVHYDEKLYPDPWEFRPERFIREDGSFIIDEKITPFQLGKRNCAARPLAHMELFLHLANVMNRYTITGKVLPPYERRLGHAFRAPKVIVDFTRRK